MLRASDEKTTLLWHPIGIAFIAFCSLSSIQSFAAVGPHSIHYRLTEQIEHILNAHLDKSNEYYRVELNAKTNNVIIPDCRSQWRFALPNIVEGKLFIKLSCDSDNPWSIHIPVMIKHYLRVAVAKQQVEASTPLKVSDLELKLTDISHLQDHYTQNIDTILGRFCHCIIQARAVINPHQLLIPNTLAGGDSASMFVDEPNKQSPTRKGGNI